MHTLFCTPLGETMRAEFTRELAEVSAAGHGREQAYLLPSDYLMRAARRTMQANCVAGYESPVILAFDNLAEDIVRSAGIRRRRMSRMAQELLVEEVVRKLAAEGQLPYFRAISDYPGYISGVTSLLAEIKGAGASLQEFAAVAEARDWQAKDREVAAIYSAYQNRLAALGLSDLEEVYFLAIDALRTGQATLPYSKIFISEFYILTPLQLELIRQLRPLTKIAIGLIYEKNRPEVFAAVEATYEILVGMGFTQRFPAAERQGGASLKFIREKLFDKDCQPAGATEGLELISAPHRDKEMAVVAAKIKELLLAGVCQPPEIAVVVRDSGLYDGFRQVCDDFKFPVSLPWKEDLADQPLVRLLDHVLTARLDNGSRHSVLNLLKSPLLSAVVPDADALERAAASFFIRSWDDWWDAAADSDNKKQLGQLRQLFGILPQEKGTCSKLVEALQQVITAINVPDWLGDRYRRGELSLPLLKAGLLTWDKLTGPEGVLAAMEQEFALLGDDEPLKLQKFLQLFRKAVASERIEILNYNESGVQVISPLKVRGMAFRAVFVLGLTDGEFPLRERGNWLYDDQDRRMLSDLGLNIGTAAYHRQEEDLYFAVAVALADEFLTVSYHEDAETMPSPYVEEVLRLFTPGAVKKEKYSVGDIFPQDYTAIFSGRELTGRLLLDGFGRAAPDGFIQQLGLPGWSAGDFAGRETGGGELEATSAAACAEPAGQETFSISALEDYALCPFSYYAKRILKLAEWAEKEEETGFDVVGTIYHEVLASFLRAHAGQKLQAGRGGEYGQELAAAVEASSQRLIDGHKIVPGKLWDYQRRRLEKNLDRWLEFEIAEQNAEGLAFTPQFFEWGFGLPQSAGMDARSVASPLELSVDGEVINIVGKVDRIDAAGDKLAVVDYKRKTCPPFRQLAQGLDLQAALYIMAVERFLCQGDGQVAGGGYYSVEARKKEGGMWRDELADEIVHRKAKRDGNLSAVEWEELQEKVRQQVGRCVAGIRAGNFPVAPAGDCPPYCIASGICRYLKGQAGGTIDD